MLGYICIGFLVRNIYESQKAKKELNKNLISMVSFFTFILFCIMSGIINTGDNISILNADYNNILTYIPLAIVGSISFIFIFISFKNRSSVEFLSKNTIFFMAIHYYYLYEWMKVSIKGNMFNFAVGLLVAITISLFCFMYRYIVNAYDMRKLEKCMNHLGLYAK